MKPAPFEFVAPDTLEAALEALQQHGYEAKVLAGGQSLIPAMNFRVMQPAVLVDLNRIKRLQYIRPTDDGGLRIGGMTRHSAVEHAIIVADRAPLLHETMPHIAHPQVRNRGTIGGSLVHADPAAELPVIAVSLDARLKLQRAGGARWVAAADFFQFLFTTDIQAGEILTEIEIPPFPEDAGWAFVEFARRKGDYALAGVAAWLRLNPQGLLQDARLVFLNLGDVPVRPEKAEEALRGESPGVALFREAARTAAGEIDPVGSVHASPDYQRHLARVLTERALLLASQRAASRHSNER